MTRKDFELLAEAIQRTRRTTSVTTHWTLDRLVENLANALAEQNERFDRARFLAAAGVQ